MELKKTISAGGIIKYINPKSGKVRVIEFAGNKHYFDEDGNRHRDGDLPAIDCKTGYKEYYKNGKLHRDNNLPAIIRGNIKKYYKNGVKQ